MKKRLSIGIFVDTFFPMIDGVVVAVDNYATRLAKDNDVTVFAPKTRDKKFSIDRPYKIIRCHTTKIPLIEYELSLPFVDMEFRKAIRKSNFDIVHIHSPFSIGKAGVKYAKKHKIPAVGTFHSQYKLDFYVRTKSKVFAAVMTKNIMKVFNRCDLGLAVNNKIKDVYKEYGSKIFVKVRNNGTDLKYYDNPNELIALKEKYHIKPEEKVLIFVGRIDKVKNIFFILEILRILKEKKFPYKMIFIGTGFDEQNLKRKIKEYHLCTSIEYLGRIAKREEVAKHFGIADLFIFPSLYDASSLVQIEAASQKTPTLFLEGAVTADTIENGFNGFTSKNDELKYAEKVISIFKDETKYEEVCENAFKTLFKSWDQVVEQTYEDYLDLIKNNKYNKKIV